METFTINIIKQIKVTAEDIDDIMATALEGGITYWCDKAIPLGTYLCEYASEQIARGGKLQLHDIEEGKSHVLTLNMLLNGISKAITHNYCAHYNWFTGSEIDTGMIDAEVADVIIQMALFGDIVYG